MYTVMNKKKEMVLEAAIAESDKLIAEGRKHEAFSIMNTAVMKNFTREGFIKALINLFDAIDDCSGNSSYISRLKLINLHYFVKRAYENVERMISIVKDKSQMHFWAGCVRICQFRTERQMCLLQQKNSILRAQEHFQCNINDKPNHMLAAYLRTACYHAYIDITGPRPHPECIPQNLNECYNHAITRKPEYLLCYCFITGKLMYYLQQHYLAERYFNVALCIVPNTPLENRLTHDSLMLLHQIANWKKKTAKAHKKCNYPSKLVI